MKSVIDLRQREKVLGRTITLENSELRRCYKSYNVDVIIRPYNLLDKLESSETSTVSGRSTIEVS